MLVHSTETSVNVNAPVSPDSARDKMSISSLLNSLPEEGRTSISSILNSHPQEEVVAQRLSFPQNLPNSIGVTTLPSLHSEDMRRSPSPIQFTLRQKRVDGNHRLSSRQHILSTSPSPSSKKKGHHSNVPYTTEQVHRMRYLKEDKMTQHEVIIAKLNNACPTVFRQSAQCASSRYYRSCIYPKVDESFNNFLRDPDGKIKTVQVNVRARSNKVYKDWPVLLVEMYPRWAVQYTWVTEQDKRRAMAILNGEDREYYLSNKDRMRRAIELWEDENPKLREEFRKLKLRNTVDQIDSLNITLDLSQVGVSSHSPRISPNPASSTSPPHRVIKREQKRSIECDRNNWRTLRAHYDV